jgi:hypothetical protein
MIYDIMSEARRIYQRAQTLKIVGTCLAIVLAVALFWPL